MDHKSLYKRNPLNCVERNRQLVRSNREKQRTNNFSRGRNVSPVETEAAMHTAPTLNNNNKENESASVNALSLNDRTSKKDKFLERLYQYKQKKRDAKAQQAATKKKPPFLVCCKNSSTASCVPKNYKFQPNLKLEQPVPQLDATNQGRRSVYELKATPSRKTHATALPNGKKSNKKVGAPSNKLLTAATQQGHSLLSFSRFQPGMQTHVKTSTPFVLTGQNGAVKTAMRNDQKTSSSSVTKKTLFVLKDKPSNSKAATSTQPSGKKPVTALSAESEKPSTSKAAVAALRAATLKPGNSAKKPATALSADSEKPSTSKAAAAALRAATAKSGNSAKKPISKLNSNSAKKLVTATIEQMQKPSSHIILTRAAAKRQANMEIAQTGGAISKIRRSKDNTKTRAKVGATKRTIKLKPDKPNKPNAINAGKKKCAPAKLARIKEMLTEEANATTPCPMRNSTFEKPFVTSTEMKPAKSTSLFVDMSQLTVGISPVGVETTTLSVPSNECNAKRVLQLNELSTETNKQSAAEKRYKFRITLNQTIETPANKKSLNDTPPSNINNNNNKLPAATYLSPSVTISRGRTNVTREKQLHDQFYAAAAAAGEYTAEQQCTLATAKHYRQQMNEEVERMHGMCNLWQTYKEENLANLEQHGADDNINATIGQTKLLTSKKFKQFSDLIERCIAGVTGEGARIDDGSEDTKPINAADLEGYWYMLKLQVDNVDKRFDNLERLKLLNWQEIDEPIGAACNALPSNKRSKENNKKTKTKQQKPKAKANSAVLEMLRKAKANYRKSKATEAVNEAAVESTVETFATRSNASKANVSLQTPIRRLRDRLRKRNSQSPTPGRIAVLVRDRKSFSAAPTIIHIPNNRADKYNSPALGTPRISPPRKSILKTPGTAKSARKNVIFNQQLEVRKFRITIAADSESEME